MLEPDVEFERVANGSLPDFDLEEFKVCDEKLYNAIIDAMKLFGDLRYQQGVQDATNAAIEVIKNHDGDLNNF
jgi:hypothetical protein